MALKNILFSSLNKIVIYYLLYKLNPETDPLSDNGIVFRVMALVSLGSILIFIKQNLWDLFK